MVLNHEILEITVRVAEKDTTGFICQKPIQTNQLIHHPKNHLTKQRIPTCVDTLDIFIKSIGYRNRGQYGVSSFVFCWRRCFLIFFFFHEACFFPREHADFQNPTVVFGSILHTWDAIVFNFLRLGNQILPKTNDYWNM